jgi:CubicO group peptidase (beta-lactamase class C family)
MDYHEYILENVLKPMELTNTFSNISESKHGNELAIGYGALNRNRDRMEVPFIDAKATASAAGFSSSAKDLAKFAMWQLKLLHGNGDDVLDHNSLREMMRPHGVTANLDNAIGYGFQLYNRNGKKYIGHSGGFMGFQSHYLIEPEQKIGAVALMSGHSTSPHQLVRRVMAVLGPVINNPKTYNPPVTLKDYQGTYDQQPWSDEIYVTPWGDNLVSFNLDTDDPAAAITILQHVSGDNFARIGNDGTLAELTKFIRHENGEVTGFINQGDEIIKKD